MTFAFCILTINNATCVFFLCKCGKTKDSGCIFSMKYGNYEWQNLSVTNNFWNFDVEIYTQKCGYEFLKNTDIKRRIINGYETENN